MSTFVLAYFTIHDRAGYKEYTEKAFPIFMREKVKIVANDEAPVPMSKDIEADKVVLLEFRDDAHVKSFFSQPDYMEAAKIRDAAATLTAIKFKKFEGA
jgi:uncharacterized protein (DUF1330 family)